MSEQESGNAPIVHRGIWFDRVTQQGPSAAREKAFAEEWEALAAAGGLQQMLLTSPLTAGAPATIQVGQREATVAATLVQWLGTPRGQDFLSRVLAEVGMKIVPSFAVD